MKMKKEKNQQKSYASTDCLEVLQHKNQVMYPVSSISIETQTKKKILLNSKLFFKESKK